MGNVQASPEIVRQMSQDLKRTINEIRAINGTINSAMSSSSNWTDAQGEQFRQLMKKVAQLTMSPVDTLNSAIPKLEKLAQALDNYNKIKF